MENLCSCVHSLVSHTYSISATWMLTWCVCALHRMHASDSHHVPPGKVRGQNHAFAACGCKYQVADRIGIVVGSITSRYDEEHKAKAHLPGSAPSTATSLTSEIGHSPKYTCVPLDSLFPPTRSPNKKRKDKKQEEERKSWIYRCVV